MIENPQHQSRIHGLRFALSGLEIVFDPRVNTITFSSAGKKLTPRQRGASLDEIKKGGASVRLNDFATFETDLKKIDASRSFSPADLQDCLKRLLVTERNPLRVFGEMLWEIL